MLSVASSSDQKDEIIEVIQAAKISTPYDTGKGRKGHPGQTFFIWPTL